MDDRRLGDSGLKVSEIGLGCNNFGMRIDQEAASAVIDAAIEHGLTFSHIMFSASGHDPAHRLQYHRVFVLRTLFAAPAG